MHQLVIFLVLSVFDKSKYLLLEPRLKSIPYFTSCHIPGAECDCLFAHIFKPKVIMGVSNVQQTMTHLKTHVD